MKSSATRSRWYNVLVKASKLHHGSILTIKNCSKEDKKLIRSGLWDSARVGYCSPGSYRTKSIGDCFLIIKIGLEVKL